MEPTLETLEQFSYTAAAQEVVFGAGALSQLDQAVERCGWQRLMLCTIERFSASGLVARSVEILDKHQVVVYARVRPHVQEDQVEEAVALAAERDVEAVIGLGGGSPIGLALRTPHRQ